MIPCSDDVRHVTDESLAHFHQNRRRMPRKQRQHESSSNANRRLVKKNPPSSSGGTDLRISSPNTSTRNGALFFQSSILSRTVPLAKLTWSPARTGVREPRLGSSPLGGREAGGKRIMIILTPHAQINSAIWPKRVAIWSAIQLALIANACCAVAKPYSEKHRKFVVQSTNGQLNLALFRRL
ncbi:unnamed protein product [Protopolystoma xenopodis]|uniref:Uncharacterized protein n=1 Tax=Protopolystoma xenopodis TaxID=117903 RepID=A0A3S5CKE2_9PLAT|nr:unnamed protein product [Protopolystoma xenopodis]